MKIFGLLFLLAMLALSLSGCCTAGVMKASEHKTQDKETGKITTHYNPAYYILLPVAVPIDAVTFPFYWKTLKELSTVN